MNTLLRLLRSDKKWKIFGLILLVIIVVGTVLSLLAKRVFIRDDETTRPYIAMAGPLGGIRAPLGLALKQGADLYVEGLNKRGGYKGRKLELVLISESAEAARQAALDPRVVGVIGYVRPAALKAAAPFYQERKLPLVTPLFVEQPMAGVYSLGLDSREQARFLANYARNVVQQRLMYVIREAGADFDPLVDPFLEVYKKFDTPVREVWTIGPGANEEQQVKAVLEAVENIDVGAIYVATRPELAARLVKGIRATGNALEIFGPEQMATAAFNSALKDLAGKDVALQSHGIVAATSVLFDTANDEAQQFQTRYQQKFNASPDWLATQAYDAVKVALTPEPEADDIRGISGTIRFAQNQAQLPIQIGIYNGARLVSAPVQLLPIAKGANFNYIEALRQGRVLYVNDRFMFKTNVVYVGVRINDVTDLDTHKETATVDMSIWFRYRGNFNPQELLIQNAVDPIKFDVVEESKSSEDGQYQRYRIKPKLRLNFTDAQRAYGQHTVGIVFRHKLLNRSNLQYVVDVLGMPTGNALVTDLVQRKVVNANSGWQIDNAWLSQETIKEQSDGAPQYVGLTGEQPQFSKITLGVLLKPVNVGAHDVIPEEFFIYIAIFGVLGSAAAIAMDRHQLKRYWVVQAYLLRLIFWPLLLLSAGNLLLDYAFTEFSQSTTSNLVNIYESMWWLIAGLLVDIALRRFLWFGLESSTGRKVPNVIKFFTSLVVGILALACVTAFVFNQALTSLLATSGLMAMVIGLAVQANIANVFSGIVLNIERPFRVGDYVKINNITGKVIDITWRTTRIESTEGQLVCLANAKVSEADVQIFSAAPNANGFWAEVAFYFDAAIDPVVVLDILKQGAAASTIMDASEKPVVSYRGIVCKDGFWPAEYVVTYHVKTEPALNTAKEELWIFVRHAFQAQNLELYPQPGGALGTA